MNNQNTAHALVNLEYHQVGNFTYPLVSRLESITETLNYFTPTDSTEENLALLSRANHLYKINLIELKKLQEALKRNDEFVNVEILHQSSDIGLPYKVFARHKSGKDVFYDGVIYRLTAVVHLDEFELSDIDELAGYKGSFDKVIVAFENSLSEIIPFSHIYSHTSYNFYTASPISWERIGIKTEGDAHLRLICRDMNIMTITGLISTETGKDYYIYLGDRITTLQMIAHDIYNFMELKNFTEYAEDQHKKLNIIKSTVVKETNGVISPFYKLLHKHKNWNSIKNSWKALGEIQKELSQLFLLIQSYNKIVDKKWAYKNGPIQIWLAGEKPDSQEQVQHFCDNFFSAKLIDSKIVDISEEPLEPMYSYKIERLEHLVHTIKDELVPTIDDEKTLLSIFQTEFSLYAVWFAVLAFIISLISIFSTLI